MQAQDLPVTQLLDGAKQFIVPIFQRDYSWGTKQCAQLWNDIIRAGKDEGAKGHFLGSVVYVAAEEIAAGIPRWLLIDGQQRLTTLTLIMTALRNRIADLSTQDDALPSSEELDDYYLRNRHGKGDRRHKLYLRRADHDTLTAVVDGSNLPDSGSERVAENFRFLTDLVAASDLRVVYNGIKRLIIVDVSLTRGQDDPQMIFESLNSTGIDLTQADLIRNFVLMRLDETTQSALYKAYWQPIEAAFGNRYRTEFDKFVRDFLVLKTRPSAPLKSDEIYHEFRQYFLRSVGTSSVEQILAELARYGAYYAAFSLGAERNEALKPSFARLRGLVEVASPVAMALYDYFDRAKTLSQSDFVEALALLESFVFRRSVCDMQTRSLGQIFANLAFKLSEEDPLLSLKVALYRQGKKRRFPSDIEFRESLETRDVYDMRTCFYLLDRLENHSKEKIDTSNFSIEHVMPRNPDLRPEWKQMLGADWKAVQETWLHRLGNLTLTGYNSTYSDRPFAEKKAVAGGFNESPLRLNRFMREQDHWTAEEIEKRGKSLAERAIQIWGALVADSQAVKKAELDDRISHAARFHIQDMGMDPVARSLFEALQPAVRQLGDDVIELCTGKTVTYRVYDFFLEVIPRKQRLTLLLNIDFADCVDPSGKSRNASESAFIVNATEVGGVILSLGEEGDIPAAIALVRQAYGLVAE